MLLANAQSLDGFDCTWC